MRGCPLTCSQLPLDPLCPLAHSALGTRDRVGPMLRVPLKLCGKVQPRVSWDPDLCLSSRECFLPLQMQPERNFWGARVITAAPAQQLSGAPQHPGAGKAAQSHLLSPTASPLQPLSSLSPQPFRLSLHQDPPLLSWRNTPPTVPSVGQPGWDAPLCPLPCPYPTLSRGDRWASLGASPPRRLDEMAIQASGQAGTKAERQASLTELGALGGRLSPAELPDLFCAPPTRSPAPH